MKKRSWFARHNVVFFFFLQSLKSTPAKEEKSDINRPNGPKDALTLSGKKTKVVTCFEKKNPFISAWDKVSASILRSFPDGFSGREQCDRVSGDFKHKQRLALPIFVCVCKDLQELVTIYRTAVKTTCVQGSLKKSYVKEFLLAQRLMLK